MTPNTQSLYEAALALPEDERILLVERLLESLPVCAYELTDQELLAEVEQRGLMPRKDG